MSEEDVKHEITDRDVEQLSKAALAAEWREAYEQLRGPIEDEEENERLWDRRTELWQEMKDRADAEAPECPECDGQKWHQTIGDPKYCGKCGLELGSEHMDTIQAIDDYWEKVQCAPEEAC